MNLKELSARMNQFGKKRTPFLAITDFSGKRCRIWALTEIPKAIQFRFPTMVVEQNVSAQSEELAVEVFS